MPATARTSASVISCRSEPGSRGTECAANRELALPQGTPRQQEMPDVHARDHEHHGDNGCHERRERLRKTATSRRWEASPRRQLPAGWIPAGANPPPAAHLKVERVQLRYGSDRRRARAETAKKHQHSRKPPVLRVGRKPKPRFDGHPEIGS